MDVYGRIQDYIEEMKGDWKTLFLSDAMGSFLRHYAENIFLGVFESLQLQGAMISPSLLETEMKRMKIERIFDPNSPIDTAGTASMNSHFTIVINGCGVLVNHADTVEEKFEIVTGLLVHEVGHRLFTDFPTGKAQKLQMEQYGRWYPVPPTNIGTVEGINLRNMLTTNLDFRRTFSTFLAQLDNCIEDGYEENELRSHYPGLASCYLAAMNNICHDTAPSMTELSNQPKVMLSQMLLSQWLQYALFGELKIGEKDITEFDPALVSAIYEGMNFIDECVEERDPLKRATLKNQLAVIAYPFLEEDINAQQQKQKNNSQQPQNGGNQAANQAVQNALNAAGSISSNGGAQSGNENSDSISLTNVNKGQNSRLRHTVNLPNAQSSNNSNGEGGSNGNGPGQGGNRSYEAPDHTIGEHDLEEALSDSAAQAIHKIMEEERTQQMQEEANEIFKGSGQKTPEIIRAAEVPETSKEEYEKHKGKASAIAERLAKMLKKQFKDEEQEETLKWQYSGRKFSSKQYCRDELKCFTKKNLPSEHFRCRIYVLVDESGSVSGELSNAEVATAMCLEQFCYDMKVPLTIQGYTTGGGSGVSIFSYVEEKRIDNQDKYRLMGMSSRGGTPTVAAMTYALGRMMKFGEGEKQILFVITDGGAGDDDYTGTETKKLIEAAKKQNIAVLGCGIGGDQEDVQAEFGEENFLGIDDLEEMPKQLVSIIRRQLLRR